MKFNRQKEHTATPRKKNITALSPPKNCLLNYLRESFLKFTTPSRALSELIRFTTPRTHIHFLLIAQLAKIQIFSLQQERNS